jgi:hypothetical protein
MSFHMQVQSNTAAVIWHVEQFERGEWHWVASFRSEEAADRAASFLNAHDGVTRVMSSAAS